MRARYVILGTPPRLARLSDALYTRVMSSLRRAVSWSPVFVALAAVLSWGAEVRADTASDKSTCPPDATVAPERTQEVLRRLRSHRHGKTLLVASGRPPVVCYGNVREGILHADGVVVLQKDHLVAANAARLGHLLHHLVHGLPFDEKNVRGSSASCDELVRTADLAERAAHALENDLRQAFRLRPLAFEDLSDAYRQRCEALRKAPTGQSSL